MSVLSRDALEQSPLADLHTIASELGLDGYRRLRKADLVGRILERAGVADDGAKASDSTTDEPTTDGRAREQASDEEEGTRSRSRRGRRGGRGRRGPAGSDDDVEYDDEVVPDGASDDDETKSRDDDEAPAPRARRSRSRRGSREDRDEQAEPEPASESGEAEGVVEIVANGSGFLRVNPPAASDDDVYISAAQVRRCELVSGDRIAGPVRPPRRSERHPSLVRVDTINGRPAEEVAEGTHFDDLPAAFPTERFDLGAEDPTLKAIEWLTPIGRGSRVTIVGGARAGKSEALRRLAGALRAQEGVELTAVLAGIRPEEAGLWASAGVDAQSALTLAASSDAQAQVIERAIDTAKRVAARGGDIVVLIDSLDGVGAAVARRALAAARNIVDGGSLTVIAASAEPVGGETTVIALDVALTSTGRFPALDIARSGTLSPELLVGQAGAEAIAKARSEKG